MEKVTLGITEQSNLKVQIDDLDYYLDVDSKKDPAIEDDSNGLSVRQLKFSVSWVNNVAIQLGFYLLIYYYELL